MSQSTIVDRSCGRTKQIIGPSFQLLSNWCSMGCAGCGIRVAPPPEGEIVDVDKESLRNARDILQAVRSGLEDNNYRFALVEQSGGEPTHHPAIVRTVGEVFPECIHKVITNGVPSASIFKYVKDLGDRVMVVLSLDHHLMEYNQLRLRSKCATNPSHAKQLHDTVLKNLDTFASGNVPVIVSSTISKWNIERYLDFITWLEQAYPRQVAAGTLVPIPVSLVSFGNPLVGALNPTPYQVAEFEKAILRSKLISVTRAREWLFLQLIAHYHQKWRHFLERESLERIEESPSRYACDIYRHMISFNFQDEEILRRPHDALFQGFICGVKALGNVGNALREHDKNRTAVIANRPSNIRKEARYFRVSEINEYLSRRDRIIDGKESIRTGFETGQFTQLRKGMCLLDDFDGVWWPMNMYIRGVIGCAELEEYCSVFRNSQLMSCLRSIRHIARNSPDTAVSKEVDSVG